MLPCAYYYRKLAGKIGACIFYNIHVICALVIPRYCVSSRAGQVDRPYARAGPRQPARRGSLAVGRQCGPPRAVRSGRPRALLRGSCASCALLGIENRRVNFRSKNYVNKEMRVNEKEIWKGRM